MKIAFLILAFIAVAYAKHEKLSSSEIWQELGAEMEDEEASNSIEESEEEEHVNKADDANEMKALHAEMLEIQERIQRRERKQRQREQRVAIKHGKACAKKKCPIGKECVIDEEEDGPICVCAKACAPETNERAMVCTSKNVTFASECELHRQRCLCQRQQLGCADPKFAHAHLDYYGPCVEIRPCTDYEQSEFPLRMREWLYLVMEELAGRDSLNNKAKMMAVRAEEINQNEDDDVSESEKWMIPVIWKFCDLDETHDDLVDDAELMPITAPLKGMEHCVGQFMTDCDKDEDGNISKTEWIKCLKIDLENIELRCDEFKDD